MDRSRYIILRFERATDYDVGGISAHGARKGEQPHVDRTRTKMNRVLIGHPDVRALCDARITELQRETAERRIEALRKSRHTKKRKELEAALEAAGEDKLALAELVGWPWDPKNVKPWTQGFLSASPEFFESEDGRVDPEKTEEFLRFGKAYLQSEFAHEVIYARADLDEKTPHIHFVVSPEHRERRTGHPMLSHNQHRLFGLIELVEGLDESQSERLWRRKSYELFQNRVASFGTDWGIALERGERRAESEREQIARGEQIIKRKNTTPAEGRKLAAQLVAEAEEKQAHASRLEREAEAKLAKAQETRENAQSLMTAMTFGLDAIESKAIEFRSATDTHEERFIYGPNAPAERRGRDAIYKSVRPAISWLLSFAKQRARFEKSRNAKLEADLAAKDQDAAELRQHLAEQDRADRRRRGRELDERETKIDAEVSARVAAQLGSERKELDRHGADLATAKTLLTSADFNTFEIIPEGTDEGPVTASLRKILSNKLNWLQQENRRIDNGLGLVRRYVTDAVWGIEVLSRRLGIRFNGSTASDEESAATKLHRMSSHLNSIARQSELPSEHEEKKNSRELEL